ncbi:MAG: hypothetical protein WA919_07780 [Coleofasciculaceae cyanobacterium]
MNNYQFSVGDVQFPVYISSLHHFITLPDEYWGAGKKTNAPHWL